MSEFFTVYRVDWSDNDDFKSQNLKGFSLLSNAEVEAKSQTQNQATRYIHRHTLEIVKQYKVEDKPQAVKKHEFVCNFENCNREQRIKFSDNHGEYCLFHTALMWHNYRESSKLERVENQSIFCPTLKPAIAREFVEDLVLCEPHLDAYYGEMETERENLEEAIFEAGIHDISAEDSPIELSKYNIKELISAIIEGGKLV
jgi:hypothetical protein